MSTCTPCIYSDIVRGKEICGVYPSPVPIHARLYEMDIIKCVHYTTEDGQQ